MMESMTLPSEIINGKYRIMNKIGHGSFGEVYLGVNIENGEQIAIKLESLFLKQSQLLLEYKVYNILQGGFGIPRVIYFGKYKHYAILVMDLLGPSLEDLFNYCGRKFSIKTVIMLAEQMILRLEYIHSKKIIHRDIKPDNFLMGLNRFCNRVFIVDFGLSKMYMINDRHIELRNDKKLTGTARYVSINVHFGLEQSRRDDMESLGYVLLYFIRGFLPWEGLPTVTRKQKYERIFERKISISIEALCSGLPEEFTEYFKYCRSLKFEEEPDYKYLRTKFQNMFYRLNFKYDYMYDWKIISRNKLLSDNVSTRENEIIHSKII